MEFRFASPVTINGSTTPPISAATVTGIGTVSNITVNGTAVTVDLTHVDNQQIITVTLNNVSDGTNSGNITVPMGVLIGDVDATGRVDGTDVSGVQSHTRRTTNANNYRFDVDASGRIDGNDVSATQAHTGTSLPLSP